MLAMSSTELANIRAAFEESLLDTCKICTAGGEIWSSDPGSLAFTAGSAIACGFDSSESEETQDGAQVTITQAAIRLPRSTVLTAQDIIMLTHRNGEALGSVEYYRIVGVPDYGVTGIRAKVMRYTGAALTVS